MRLSINLSKEERRLAGEYAKKCYSKKSRTKTI